MAPEVRQRTRVVLPVETRCGVERQVMVDALSEVGVAGRNRRVVEFRGRSGHVSVINAAISAILSSDGTNGGSRGTSVRTCPRAAGTLRPRH
jgi:hypothetical protein